MKHAASPSTMLHRNFTLLALFWFRLATVVGENMSV